MEDVAAGWSAEGICRGRTRGVTGIHLTI